MKIHLSRTWRIFLTIILAFGVAGVNTPGAAAVQPDAAADLVYGQGGSGPAPAPQAAPLLESTQPFTDFDQDLIDDNLEQTLIERFRPYVIFHHCEDYFPSTVDYYLNHSVLHYFHKSDPDHTYEPRPIGNSPDLLSQSHDDSSWSGTTNQQLNGQPPLLTTNFYVNAETSTHPGQALDVAEIYAHVHSATTSQPGMIDIQYWFFYPYNGNMGFVECANLEGEHEGDWEHITVRVQPDGTPHAVYYARHAGEGGWYLPDRGNGAEAGYYAVYQGTDRPVVYPGYHSHASYTTADKFVRGGGKPPDYTGGGKKWDIRPEQVRNTGELEAPFPGMSWIQFTGHWGEFHFSGDAHPEAPNGPAEKGSWFTGDGGDDTHSDLSTIPGSHPIIPPATEYNFDLGSASDGTLTSAISAEVIWGDGTWTTGLQPSSTLEGRAHFEARHTYAAEGDYNVRVTYSNGMVANYQEWVQLIRPPQEGGDLEPPQVQLEIFRNGRSEPDGPNGWFLGDVILQVTAEDTGMGVFAVRCALDPQTPPLTYANLPNAACPYYPYGANMGGEGVHTLYAAAIDRNNNTSIPVSLSFKLDPSSPSIECDVDPLLYNSGTHVVEPSAVYAGASGLDVSSSTLTGVVSTDSIGRQNVPFTAYDLAGHVTHQLCSFYVISSDTPTVDTFTFPLLTNTLDIPIVSFSASTHDGGAVSGYLITETGDQPDPGDARWTDAPPDSYPVAFLGRYTLYPWAKNAVGKISVVSAYPASVLVCSDNIMVKNDYDDGPDSLRRAMANLCPGGTITFDPGLSGKTITLESGLLSFDRGGTINGSGLAAPVSISGGHALPVFAIPYGVTATLEGLKIVDGYKVNGGAGIFNEGILTLNDSTVSGNTSMGGGGIENLGILTITGSILSGNTSDLGGGGISNSGTLSITGSTLSDNTSGGDGGGIANGGTLTITATTLSGNRATMYGGAIHTAGYVNMTIVNSTLANNSARFGGAINANLPTTAGYTPGTLTLLNSTLSGNSAEVSYGEPLGGGLRLNGKLDFANTIIANSPGGGDCSFTEATIVRNLNNLADDATCGASLVVDPKLAVLADNGGPTQTMALAEDSKAIDAGISALPDGTQICPAADQRGVTRPQGAACDIGAYELEVAADTTPPVVDSFTAPSYSTSLDIPITTFTAHDDTGVTGYKITTSATLPGSGDSGWMGTTPATYTVAGTGLTTLYPWAEDAAGNISAVYANPPKVWVCSSSHITVTNNAASGAGTLSQAVHDLCPGGTIDFDGDYAIQSAQGIGKDMTIDGGMHHIILGNLGSSYAMVFNIVAGASVHLNSLTLGNCGRGSCIRNQGTLQINNSTFEHNTPLGNGGAIYNSGGDLSVTNSTFWGNQATHYGGAIYNTGSGIVQIKNSTFIGNSAENGGGAIYNNSGSVSLASSIVTLGSGSHCAGAITDGGGNLVWSDTTCPGTSADPMLGNLADNGGPTRTLSLLPGSPAIDALDPSACPATDQRGVSRPQGARCDTGAFEVRTCTVTTALDSGSGSLREKLADRTCGIINFDGSYKIILESPLPYLNRDLVLDGSGHSVWVDGDDQFRVFSIELTESGYEKYVSLKALTVADGRSAVGAGIYCGSGKCSLSQLTLYHNIATDTGGGGIYADDDVQIVNSTFSQNSAPNGTGGAIFNAYWSTNILNSTFAGNSAQGAGGAIHNEGGSVSLVNSIVTGPSPSNCDGTIADGGGNLTYGDTTCPGTNADPKLGPLQDNGGPTQTMALVAGSAAIDALDASTCPASDQRGISRPQGALCDIGAYETTTSTTTVTFEAGPYTYRGTAFTATAVVTGADGLDKALSVSYSGDCTNVTSANGCSASASYSGDTTHTGSDDTQFITITKASQAITFPAILNHTYLDPDFAPGASASSSLAVSYSATGNCTIVNGKVHITGAGSCTVTASQAGDDNYNAAPDKSQSFNIAKASQSITFPAISNKTFGDADFDPAATATSGLAVSYNAVGNCTIVSDKVHITGAGSCTVTASQTGDNNYNAAPNVSRTFSIAPAATSLVLSLNPAIVQYSDPFTLSASVSPVSVGVENLTGTVEFRINAVSVGSAPINSSGIATLSNVANLRAPGKYAVTAVFTSKNSNFGNSATPASAGIFLTVTQEDARTTYTGNSLFWGASSSATSATVTLIATIKDITAVTGDPASDTFAGDIRNAKVTFLKDGSAITGCRDLAVSLVSVGDTKVGTVTCSASFGIGSSGASQYTLGIQVNNYYTRYHSDESVVIDVAQPLTSNFITGGGHLVITNSAGQYAATAGSKANFGFHVKYNKTRTNLQGGVNILFRSGGKVYQIKSNSMTSLGVNPSPCSKATASKPCTASFISKATLTDVTNPGAPISLGGNLTLQMQMTDKGDPGSSDTLAIALYNGSSLLFSSSWNGTKTVEQFLGSGNLVVH